MTTGWASPRLKILVCSANHAPELTGVGKYTGDMVAWLAARGHEVRVVAAPPYYPAWRVAPEWRRRMGRQEQRDGARVWRAPLWVPAKAGGLARVLHLLSFGLGAAPLLLWWALRWRPDVVLCVAPFLTAAPASWLAARCAGARTWLHVQDFEVDVAFNMGLLRGPRLREGVLALERALLRRFDRVSSISLRMLERLPGKGVAADRVVLFRNWVDTSAIRPLQQASPYRADLGLGDGDFVVMFSGTLNGKQGLHVLPELARRLQRWPGIRLVVCGDGPVKQELVHAAQGLDNIQFLPLQPLERLGELLGAADLHLLPQDPAAEDLVLPSKLCGMLASGRPVLATVRPETEIARTLAGCGVVVPELDPARMAEAIAALAAQPEHCRQLGERAAQQARIFDRDDVLRDFEASLGACVRAEGPASSVRA